MSGGDWRERAACLNVDLAVFFPHRPSRIPAERERLETARAVCDGCPVWEQCLEAMLAIPATYDRDGVFAGLTARERSDLSKDQRSPERRRPVDHYLGGPLDKAGLRRLREPRSEAGRVTRA